MKKLGLVLGSIASIAFAGCGLDAIEDSIDQLQQPLVFNAQSALGGGGYTWGGVPGNYSPGQDPQFKVDSATYSTNEEFTIWTSFKYDTASRATLGEIQVRYSWGKESKSFSTEYLPDTVGEYLVFPVEIAGLKSQTDYTFCLLLELLVENSKQTFTSPCIALRTS
ncbi:hypothetical protein [Algoriphagus sp. A40]|uniref:hypothetical protein n=1 Tax=Algoriphagus sp. A40 TaxID=1945863 RepID=UPI000987969F|nr:hypothetical protein [Algoriphagus sp. A40]OOG72181.1 hypothetical protein B0E43_16260 [Algoriphagus sp. A40]